MNYIQYMKPGSKFWALPNGQRDLSWPEFWNNWKEAIAKAKEQIVDNLENLKQDYKDATDPIATSKRKQAESIEATRAKQASMKFVSDNRTDYEKDRDRKNLELKEFEQKQQQNKEATNAMMWTLTGIPYAVQHLASPNGVIKTYGNTKAAIQNGGGPYIEKVVASAAGDALDATILAAPLFTPEARLARAMNKNIRSAKFTNIPIYHGSTFTGHSAQFNGRTAKEVGLHFADSKFPGNYRLRVKEMPKGSNMREGILTYTQYNQPLQINDRGIFDLTSFNQDFAQNPDLKKIFNAEDIAYLKNLGYTDDAEIAQLLLKESGRDLIYQNATEINPGWSYLTANPSKLHLNHYAPLSQMSKTPPTKTSLAFFERQPAKISEAERLGVPKGIKYYTQEENLAFRNQINDFAKKYGYEPIGDEVTDPEVLERYARSLIKRHNTFYRGVVSNPSEPHLSLEYMATHAPGGGAGELYITPYEGVAQMYGHPVEILRPYKLGADRTRWFDEGNFPIYTSGGRREMHLWENKKGITAPWLTSENFESRWYKPNVEGELTGRNQQFIPMSIKYRPHGYYYPQFYRVGSLAVPTTAFYKSGGSIHIKKKNRGKFTDYCGGKVTEECIRKGKNSSNPTTRKRANFAANARKWKHKQGGKINYLNMF